jgi:hypothetical protein
VVSVLGKPADRIGDVRPDLGVSYGNPRGSKAPTQAFTNSVTLGWPASRIRASSPSRASTDVPMLRMPSRT